MVLNRYQFFLPGREALLKMIYYSNAANHVSQIAGAIHCNRLPMDRIPTTRELAINFQIDGPWSAGYGIPLLMGNDEFGNQIFQLDFGSAPNLGLQTASFLLAAHSNPLDWKFFDIRVRNCRFLMKSGLILYHLKIKQLGKIIVARDLQKCYQQIAELVKKSKELGKRGG